MYSQNKEEEYILSYFKNKPAGKFLEIGAFNPFRFSNTRALFENGWGGVMVEPSPKCMARLKDVYGNEPRIKLIEAVVNSNGGIVDFYEESHGYAVSSTNIFHKQKWEADTNFVYEKIQVQAIDMVTLLSEHGKDVGFINIDTEGTDYELFCLLPDWFLQQVKMVCIEHDNCHIQIINKLSNFGFNTHVHCGDNLISFK